METGKIQFDLKGDEINPGSHGFRIHVGVEAWTLSMYTYFHPLVAGRIHV